MWNDVAYIFSVAGILCLFHDLVCCCLFSSMVIYPFRLSSKNVFAILATVDSGWQVERCCMFIFSSLQQLLQPKVVCLHRAHCVKVVAWKKDRLFSSCTGTGVYESSLRSFDLWHSNLNHIYALCYGRVQISMSVWRHHAVRDARTTREVTDACVTPASLWTPPQESA